MIVPDARVALSFVIFAGEKTMPSAGTHSPRSVATAMLAAWNCLRNSSVNRAAASGTLSKTTKRESLDSVIRFENRL
jgi:hypothetical protein